VRKQTEAMQKRWVQQHLNRGVLPDDDAIDWYRQAASRADGNRLACLGALRWLEGARPNITTLADAWDRCPRPDWLVWALLHLQPSKSDVKKIIAVVREVGDYCRSEKVGLLSNPWEQNVFDNRLRSAEAVMKDFSFGAYDSMKMVTTAAHQIFCPWFDDNWVCPDKKKLPKMRAHTRHAANIFRKYIPNPWR